MHLEIERKWLIAYPDPTLLASMPGAEASRITQTYLTSHDGLSRRVRARTVGDTTTYTCTTKRRINAAAAEEDESVISVEAYADLLREADPACRPIEKIRWCIPHGQLTLEIDLYPFWKKQAVLEIELPSPDTAVSLPAEIRILREVTGVKGYSNHALAHTIPAE